MADPNVRTYDPNSIIVSFMGKTLAGFAEGSFLKIKRSGDMFTKVKGADGSVDRINNNAFDFEVTLSLKQTTPSNTLLSGIAAADQLLNKGVGMLIIKDNAGTTLFTAAQAWIRKDPDADFADKLSPREWTFDTGVAAFLLGGN